MRVYAQDDANKWFFCSYCEHEELLREEKVETINLIFAAQQTYLKNYSDALACSG